MFAETGDRNGLQRQGSSSQHATRPGLTRCPQHPAPSAPGPGAPLQPCRAGEVFRGSAFTNTQGRELFVLLRNLSHGLGRQGLNVLRQQMCR